MSGILGCATEYQARIHWRGGQKIYADLDGITALGWGRRLDAVSDASVTIAKGNATDGCCAKLATVYPWTHELSIYRDGVLVWQGPIIETVENRTTFTITANDVLAWLSKRVVGRAYSMSYSLSQDICETAWWACYDAFHPTRSTAKHRVTTGTDCNIYPYVQWTKAGISYTYTGVAMAKTAKEVLDDMEEQGLDYTTLGRRIIIGPEAGTSAKAVARLSESDFFAELELVHAGSDVCNVVWSVASSTSSSSSKTIGYIAGSGNGSAAFDLLEHPRSWDWPADANLQTINSSDTTAEKTKKTKANTAATAAVTKSRNTVKANMTSWRTQYLKTHLPPVPVIRVPADSTLSPDAPVQINQLVCGQRIDVFVTGGNYCQSVTQGFRLAQVDVDWTVNSQRDSAESSEADNTIAGEKVTISFTPLSGQYSDDSDDSDA